MHSELILQRCLQLANKGKGWVKTNPLVGAVITKDDRIIGEGWHQKFGHHHAEVNAIQDAQTRHPHIDLSQCNIYVNLEPCCYHGKTPACTDAIMKHRFQQVYVGTLDPNPKIAGRGKSILEEAGIPVHVSKHTNVYAEHQRVFFTNIHLKRAYITLKWAESADGFIAKKGQRTAISSPVVNRKMHQLRSEVDGILVGANTVQIDNPTLTSRIPNGKNPIRIMLAGNKPISTDWNIMNQDVETIIYGKQEANLDIPKHAVYMEQPQALEDLCATLLEKNIGHLLVEGGRQVLQSFIDSNLFDEVYRITSKNLTLQAGISSPIFQGLETHRTDTLQDRITYFRNKNI